ncbi:MAG TPA: sensor domain-containing diguanylate cyclase [Gemmatimonadaceae bacterium]|nr:sensor domain-containing diguanylate cyclase [Gemmatimonadaceae bacterium]
MFTSEITPSRPTAGASPVRANGGTTAWTNPILVARTAAGVAVLTGGLALVGWAAGVPELRTLGPAGLAATNPTTALCFVALGSALWILTRPAHRRSGQVALVVALAVSAVGVASLYGLLFGASPGADELLFGRAMRSTGDGRLNRMAPNAAFNFALLGLAMAMQLRRRRFPSVLAQIFAVIVLFTAQAALIAHAYQSGWFESVGWFNRMTMPTALAFVALAVGIMTLSSEDGLIGIVLSDGPGGSLARILLPTGFLVPAVLGWLVILSRRASLMDADLADTLFVLATMLVFVAMVAWIATQLHESHLDRLRTETALRESEVRFRLIAENSSDVVCLLDLSGRVVYASPSCERVLGFLPDEMMRMAPFAIIHPLDAERVRRHFNLLVRGEPVTSIQCQVLHKTGRHIWLDMMWRSVLNAHGEVERLQVASRDITDSKQYEKRLEEAQRKLREQQVELEEMNERLKSLASTDALTGLKNRRAFEERLDRELSRSRRHGHPLSLILLDIDHFKSYNDTYGHPKGDEILRIVGRLLTRTMRETDFASRYGGEEFAILLPDTDREGAQHLAERLRHTIESAKWPDRPITASVGVASYSGQASTAEALIDYADRALYRSKQLGRNRVTMAEVG